MTRTGMAFHLICAAMLALVCMRGATAQDELSDQQFATARDFFQYVFNFTLDATTAQAIRDGFNQELATNPQAAQQTIASMEAILAWKQNKPAFNQTLLRLNLEPLLVSEFPSDHTVTRPMSLALLRAWRDHNKPIIAYGTPPLRQSVLDDYIALVMFIDKQTGRAVPAAFAHHAQFSADAASLYEAASPEQMLSFNNVVPLWYQLQYVWAHASASDKSKLVAAWRLPSSGSGATATGALATNGYQASPMQAEAANPQTAAENMQRLQNNHNFIQGIIDFGTLNTGF